MPIDPEQTTIRLGLPKGRMQEGVLQLFADARIHVHVGARGYRPQVSLPGYEAKLLKPQNIVEMLHAGSRDIGFAGADWVSELGAELVELLDTEMDPVRIVAAAPGPLVDSGEWEKRHITVVSEYERLAAKWIEGRGLDATQIRSFGATEAFPPDDADVIVDNTASGSTLEAHGLIVIDEVMRSSTRLYANPRALEDPRVRESVDELVLLLRSVLDARKRVLIEVNVAKADLESVCDALPCMREPTIASLHSQEGFAVRAAVLRDELPQLVPLLKARGASDIVVTSPSLIVP